jgi:dephospho-CoA kinase
MSGKRPIIALLGPRGCGKSSIAKLLCNHGYETASFADPLRKLAGVCGPERFNDRGLLLEMGEVLRTCDPQFFLRSMANALQAKTTPVVIDDVRFQREYDWLKQKGAVMIRLTLDEMTQLKRVMERDKLTQHQAMEIISCNDEGRLNDCHADLSLVSKGEFQELVSKILFHVECQPQHERYENVV